MFWFDIFKNKPYLEISCVHIIRDLDVKKTRHTQEKIIYFNMLIVGIFFKEIRLVEPEGGICKRTLHEIII